MLLSDGPGVPGEGTLRCPISSGSLWQRQPLRAVSRRTGASGWNVSRAGLAVTARGDGHVGTQARHMAPFEGDGHPEANSSLGCYSWAGDLCCLEAKVTMAWLMDTHVAI